MCIRDRNYSISTSGGTEKTQYNASIGFLRNRAFGNMEVGKSSELTAKFNSYFRNLASVYGDNRCV